MRFETKFDRWIVAVMVGGVALSLVVPAELFFTAVEPHRPPLWCAILPWLIWGVVLTCMLPQYYEVRTAGLFIRQGWRKILIPYAALVGIQAVSDAHSAGVFSTDRLLVTTRQGKCYVIAPAEQRQFLDEVSQKTLLERRGSGIGLPLSPLTGI
jgi:hypothetical protein